MILLRLSALYAMSAVLLLTPIARGQGAGKSAAVAAFDDAERLSDAGNYAEACPKYAESNRLDPQLGALMHLADCYEKAGLLASAWVTFRDAADIAKQRGDTRLQVATARARSLESRLSRLQIDAPVPSVPGLELRRDGVLLDPALWGTPLPIDPGPHNVRASAPGRQTWEKTLNANSNGLTESVVVPPLALMPVQAQASRPPAVSPSTHPEAANPAPAALSEPDDPGSARRALGWVGLGVGAVGLGVGTVFLVQRSNKLKTRDGICASSKPEDCPMGSQARVDHFTEVAESATTHARIALLAGGVLAAAGAVLLLTLPDQPTAAIRVAPLLGAGFQGIMVSGNVF